ncbi:MAG: hypothetical protein V3W41_01265 [Planctomycetota bacterium]
MKKVEAAGDAIVSRRSVSMPDEHQPEDVDSQGSSAAPAAPGLTQIVVVLILFPALLTALVYLGDALHGSERYEVDLVAVHWNPPPPSRAMALAKASLADQSLIELRRSIFDRDLGFVVRQDFESNPWVRRVESVRRIFPRGLEIKLDYRLPFATVERDGVYLVADRDGELLPIEGSEPMLPFPIIQTRSADPDVVDNEDVSEAWFLDAVREGVAVLHDLEREQEHEVFGRIGVIAIDTSNFQNRLTANRSEVVLVTNRSWSDEGLGVRGRPVLVHWGRSSKHRYEKAEIPVKVKLRNFLGMLNLRADLHGVDLIDVRYEMPYWRPYIRPIVQAP